MLRTSVALVLFSTATAQEIREDWVTMDLAMIPVVKTAIAQTDSAAFLAALRRGDTREERIVGFGARRVHVAVYGGYTTVWVKALLVGQHVVSVDAFFDVGRDSWTATADRLLDAWDADAELEEYGFRATRTDPKRLLALHRRIVKALGTPDADEWIPTELRPALATLLDPLAELDFGTMCYDDGAPPPGRPEIEALRRAGRTDLVRRVLRSPNPEARVYAAEALLSTGVERTDADRAAIAVVRDAPIRIRCCDGCELSDRKAAEILPAQD